MSPQLMSLVLIGSMVVLLALGAEVFAAIGIVAAIGLLFVGQTIGQFGFTAFATMNSFVLTAVPLFIFMGALLGNSGIVRSLFNAADKWVGGLPGGVASSVIVANAVFGALCGSTMAATATFGKIAYPDMERLGYEPKLALGSIAMGSNLSAAIPPSLILLIYGAFANVSVPRLFAATLIPGLVLMTFFVLTVILRVKLNPGLAPRAVKHTWGERLTSIRDLLPWIGLIVVILGGIFGGVMTPTEAAGVGAFLSILLALAYRRLTFAALKDSVLTAITVTSMVSIILVVTTVLTQVFTYLGLVDVFSAFMGSLPLGKYGIIAILYLIYVVGGMLVDDVTLMLITIPFVLPLVTGLGFSPLWLGVFFVMLEAIATISPPFGLNLFVLHGVVPKHSVMTIALGALPFVIAVIFASVLLVAFPVLALWLPGVLY